MGQIAARAKLGLRFFVQSPEAVSLHYVGVGCFIRQKQLPPLSRADFGKIAVSCRQGVDKLRGGGGSIGALCLAAFVTLVEPGVNHETLDRRIGGTDSAGWQRM